MEILGAGVLAQRFAHVMRELDGGEPGKTER